MPSDTERPDKGLGLLANGSSGRWDVDVDESHDGKEWFLDLNGPKLYLVVQLQELSVLERARRYLEGKPTEDRLTLGSFGKHSVSLIWDDEDFPRCFLVIGQDAACRLHVSFDADDIRMIREALGQVVADLPAKEAR